MVRNPLITIAKQHYETLGVRQIHIPEWDATIYVRPMTLGEQSKLFAMRAEKDRGELEVFAMTVMLKAQDEDGKRLFTDDDYDDLLNHVDSTVLQRVATEIMQTSEVGALKNS